MVVIPFVNCWKDKPLCLHSIVQRDKIRTYNIHVSKCSNY